MRYSLTGSLLYFIPARIDAHGTFYYTPDGLDQVARNDFTFEDADASINQPSLRPSIEIGILLRLGD